MVHRIPSALAVLALGLAAAMIGASFTPLLAQQDPHLWRAGGVILGALGLWSTGALPEAVTSVGFFLAVILLGVGTPPVAFSGFYATAFWLVFGGMLIGLSVKRTGLGERLARGLVGRLGESYGAVLGGITLVAMVLAFVMPSSTGRVMLMMPVVLSLCDHLGYPHGGRGRAGVALLTGMMCFNPPTAVLPAVVPNMVMMGAAETQYGIHFQYLPWLLAHFPTTGILKALLIMGLCWLMFRQPAHPRPNDQAAPLPPLSRDEKRLLLILMITLGLWATDSLHGISPAWVAMAAGLACLLPGLGAKEPLIPLDAFQKGVNFAFLLHVAGLLSLGSVVAYAGLGDALGGWLIRHLPLSDGNTAGNFFALAGISSLTGMATTVPGVPAVLTPLAQALSQASGWPIHTVLMIEVVGYSTVVLPYQVPPLIVAMHMAGIAPAQGARLTLAVCAMAILLVWPLTLLWWSALSIL
jgi:di/tricarboxylate transporter